MQKLENIKKWLWRILTITSVIGVVLMATYSFGFYEQRKGPAQLSPITGEWISRSVSLEHLYFFFYFTLISNCFAVVISVGTQLKLISWDSKHWQRVKVMAAVNLFITFLVYWFVLAKDANWHDGLSITSNMFVHLLTPILVCGIFIFESVVDKVTPRKIEALSTTMWNFFFPALWLIVAIALYFGTGGHEHSAIYAKILDFNYHPTTTAIAIVGIAALYIGLTFGATYLYSRKTGIMRKTK